MRKSSPASTRARRYPAARARVRAAIARPAQIGDARVTQIQQMTRGQPAAVFVVGGDGKNMVAGLVAVDKNQRHTEARQHFPIGLARPRTEYDQSVCWLAEQQPHGFDFLVGVTAGAGDDQAIARGQCFRLDAAHDGGGKGVAQAGGNDAKRLAGPGDQTAGGGAGHVADIVGNRPHSLACIHADRA